MSARRSGCSPYSASSTGTGARSYSRNAAPTTAGCCSRTVTGALPRGCWPRRSRCPRRVPGAARIRVRNARRTQGGAGPRRGRHPGAARRRRAGRGRRGGRLAAPRSRRAIGGGGCPASTARRDEPDRLDVAAVIELLGEAEIALLEGNAAIERGRALVALGAVPGVTSSSPMANACSGMRSRRRTLSRMRTPGNGARSIHPCRDSVPRRADAADARPGAPADTVSWPGGGAGGVVRLRGPRSKPRRGAPPPR